MFISDRQLDDEASTTRSLCYNRIRLRAESPLLAAEAEDRTSDASLIGGRNFFSGSVVLCVLGSKLLVLKLDLAELSHVLGEVRASLQGDEELCFLAVSS